ncbi:class I adenylate-forming enzyme family protein [Tabrizicola sp.]|uniref:class I adenylate-forming enzyme family protein n=1 Tax=Tabrizicola sp. TaxID=2005166 RepID=UPI00286B2816|nr:class I adenylate-forming enzyme family protein [Tabrizicola sp.]
MTNSINIAFAFKDLARQFPNREAIIAEDITITYANLWRVIERFAAKMQSKGVGRRSVVGIDTTDMIVSVASIFALSILGASYILIDRDFLVGGRQGITHFFRSPEREGIVGLAFDTMDETWSPKFPCDVSTLIDEPGFSDPRDTCWILGSSGTTGRPKFVSIDQETVWKRISVVKLDYPQGQTRIFLIFGCNTRPFGIRAASILLSGNTIIDSHDVEFLQAHGVNLVCGSPKQLAVWLGDREISPKISRLQASGSKLTERLGRKLLQSFDIVEDVYGSSETIAAYINKMQLVAGEIECRGGPVESDVEILDSEGNLSPIGQPGAIRIRNKHMAQAYDGLAEESAKRFKAGWFYPGDLAKWEPNGVLRILGRDDDVVNLGGMKFNLSDLDASMTASPLVNSACCFVDPLTPNSSQLSACLQPIYGASAQDAARSAWDHCAQAFGDGSAPRSILVVQEVLLTQDGVPRRKANQAFFASAVGNVDGRSQEKAVFQFQATPNAK